MRTSILLPMLACTAALASFEGMSTHFDGVGYPYGACGVPDSTAWNEAAVDTPSGQGNPFLYVALNVFDTPGNYGSPTVFGNRPLVGADTVYLGMYDNGRNCGRWIMVQLGDFCNGTNDGAENQPFCRGGTGWAQDSLNGASLDVLVFDQCTDGNAWCRDSKYHLDLHTPILAHFQLDGKTVALATPANLPIVQTTFYDVGTSFNNREVLWDFETAPNYQGEPRFYFSVDSKAYYMRLIVTHLPNGIHGVDQWTGGQWVSATMQSDAGQQWILPDASVTSFKLRLWDAADQLVMQGRTWTLDYPAACGTSCTAAATPAENVVGDGGSLAIRTKSTLPNPVRQSGRLFKLSEGTQATVEFRDLSGALLGRMDSKSAGPKTWTAPRSGLMLATWQSAGARGVLRFVAP